MHGDADMQQVEGVHSSACSWTHERPCHIVRQLPACNRLLFSAGMTLQEIPGARGQLALVIIDDPPLLLPETQDFKSRQIAGFMRSLLKHHQCVASLSLTRSHFDKYTSPLCDALPHSCLKKLSLSCGVPMPEGICAAIPSLTSLEELELSFDGETGSASYSDSCAEFPAALAALVRASPCLVRLSLSGISMEQQAMKHLLTCLTESGVLKDLTLDVKVPETCSEKLTQYLMSSSSLTSLRFATDSKVLEIAVLEGILYNRTVSKVQIVGFMGNAQIIQLVARILSENTVVKSFFIRSVRETVSPVDHVAYDSWLEAFRQNEALEELWIPYQIWNTEQWIRASHILSSKQRLKKVYFFPAKSDDYLFRHVCRTLEESGVQDKASCGFYIVKDNADLLKCKLFSGLYFSYDTHEDLMVTALRQLLNCRHVTFLNLDIRMGNLAVSSALAEYVQSTSVLRELHIDVRPRLFDESILPDTWWRLIVNSLSGNNSVKHLNISVSNMSDSDVESLAEAVSAKTNIRRLTFAADDVMTLNAFVNRLSVGIMDNHTLLSVVLSGRLDQEEQDALKKLFDIYEAAHRNSGLLAAAAAFSKATDLHRYSDAALERICKRHSELLEDLAQLVNVSAAEIGGMAHRHLRRTASLDEYMRITGVVKERVVCHPRDDGRMQLDDLGEDCWEMVRRFLMLDDVVETVTHLENF